MTVVYSTDDVHPRDRVSYWLDDVLRGFINLSPKTDGGPFQARMRAGCGRRAALMTVDGLNPNRVWQPWAVKPAAKRNCRKVKPAGSFPQRD